MKTVEEINEWPVPKATFKYCIIGPGMSHNYLCAVCKSDSAVNNGNTGILEPCWDCQEDYKLIKLNWFLKLFKRWLL